MFIKIFLIKASLRASSSMLCNSCIVNGELALLSVCVLVLLRDVFMAHCKSFNITLTKRGALVNSHCCVFCSIKDCEFDFHTVKHIHSSVSH